MAMKFGQYLLNKYFLIILKGHSIILAYLAKITEGNLSATARNLAHYIAIMEYKRSVIQV